MNLLILLSIILSVLLGVGRAVDLALFTDPASGLCTAGSVWLRYAALAAVVGIAVAAGRGGQPKPDALRGRCVPSGVAALAAAVCYGETAVLRILWMGSSAVMLIRADDAQARFCVGEKGQVDAPENAQRCAQEKRNHDKEVHL